MVYICVSWEHMTILCLPVMNHYTIASIRYLMKPVHSSTIVHVCLFVGYTTTLCLPVMSHYTIAFTRHLIILIYPHGNVYVHVSREHTVSRCLHSGLNELHPSRLFFKFMLAEKITPPSASLSWVTTTLLSLLLISLSSNSSTPIPPNLCL